MPVGSGRYPSGQRGQTVNLLANAFGGSNPPLPTIVTGEARPDRIVGGLLWAGHDSVALTDQSNCAVRPLSRSATAPPGRCRALGVWGPYRGSRVSRSRGNSSAVERQPSKLGVAGSNPVSRSREIGDRGAPRLRRGAAERWGVWGPYRGPHGISRAHVAQTAERVLGKDEVSGSIPDMGSNDGSSDLRIVDGR